MATTTTKTRAILETLDKARGLDAALDAATMPADVRAQFTNGGPYPGGWMSARDIIREAKFGWWAVTGVFYWLWKLEEHKCLATRPWTDDPDFERIQIRRLLYRITDVGRAALLREDL